MLDAIVKGSTLVGEDGLFPLAKSQNRFNWDTVVDTYDSNTDQVISKQEFNGTAGDFERLYRNGDQKLSATDFDWSEHSLVPTPRFVILFMADRDANGKVTREEFASLFDQLAAGGANYLALDDLRTLRALGSQADRWAIEEHFQDVKEV